MKTLQSIDPIADQATDADDVRDHRREERHFTFQGPWFASREAMAYIPCATLRALYQWCHRWGIVRRRNGSIAKADLDRVLRRRTVRRMAPASLANLQKRRRA